MDDLFLLENLHFVLTAFNFAQLIHTTLQISLIKHLNMKTLLSAPRIFGLFLFLSIFSISCTKSTKTTLDAGNFEVYITDAPGDFQSVFLDIQKVEIKIDDNPSTSSSDTYGDNDDDGDDSQSKDSYGYWTSLNFTPAVIDILALRNGVEAKLGEVNIPKGTVRKIRLTLGTKNTIVVGGKTFNLTLKNDTNNFLYVKLNDRHKQRGNATSTNMASWIDFDIAKSIDEKNGAYELRPKLRPFCNSNYGEVEGTILPLSAKPSIVISNTTGFSGVALPDRDGKFKLRGLDEGTYKIVFQGNAPFVAKTLNNVTVTKGKTTDLGSTTLTQ